MVLQLSPEIERQIQDRIASGEYGSPDEVLRAALDALRQADSDLTSIQEAIDDWQSGDEGLPLDDAFRWILEGQSNGPTATRSST